ncbi:MAG: hypothetical protein JWP97_4702, partial [Labilithrix sp.]|nr:hypothetical protein [Labilithrix sp.]
PFALPSAPRDELTRPGPQPLRLDAWEAAIRAKGIAAPAPACVAFVKRAPATPAPADVVAALGAGDAARIDAALAALEPEADRKEAGLVRALRADLAPEGCADQLVDPYLAAHRTLVSRASHVLVGLSLAAKLARTGASPPRLPPTAVETEKVKAFIRGPLLTWMVEQSTAIETLSAGAAGLTGYGRGIAALGAGNADLRLVSAIRSAPTPAGWDPELRSIYEIALDEALEPRKRRGRDAALVGLSDAAQAGVLADERTNGARLLLSSLYGGRRIDALGDLMWKEPPAPEPKTPREKVIATLSPFWIDTFDLVGPPGDELPAGLGRGVPFAVRSMFAGDPAAKLRPDIRDLYAARRFALGARAWRRVDFVEAGHAARAGGSAEDRLLLALAAALAQGPASAAEMMRAPTPSALELHHTEALDALVAEGGPYAGWAAFDAAHLRSLAVPEGSAAGPHLRDVAARFRRAESLLAEDARKQTAHRRAEEIDAILATLDAKSR